MQFTENVSDAKRIRAVRPSKKRVITCRIRLRFSLGLVVLVCVFHAICMQSPENVSDAERISGSAAVEKNVLSRVVSVWRLFVGLVVLVSVFHAICMQCPEHTGEAPPPAVPDKPNQHQKQAPITSQ